MTAFFVSDLHLAAAGGPVFDHFARFVDTQPARGDSLYVLGDLFDAWAGDDDIDAPANRAIIALLAGCAARGATLYWIAGNRDFLAGAGFTAAARMTPLPDPHTLDLCGERTVLSHGDLLCTDDRAYQAFRTEARSAGWRDAFLGRPLAERKAAITGMRAQSEREKAVKPADIMDVNAEAVARLFTASGATRMIHGHTHRPGCHDHLVDGRRLQRWVLPAWEDRPGGLAVDSTGARALALG